FAYAVLLFLPYTTLFRSLGRFRLWLHPLTGLLLPHRITHSSLPPFECPVPWFDGTGRWPQPAQFPTAAVHARSRSGCPAGPGSRSEVHTSDLQSRFDLVC